MLMSDAMRPVMQGRHLQCGVCLVKGGGGVYPGIAAVFSCDDGYELYGGSAIVKCGTDGKYYHQSCTGKTHHCGWGKLSAHLPVNAASARRCAVRHPTHPPWKGRWWWRKVSRQHRTLHLRRWVQLGWIGHHVLCDHRCEYHSLPPPLQGVFSALAARCKLTTCRSLIFLGRCGQENI